MLLVHHPYRHDWALPISLTSPTGPHSFGLAPLTRRGAQASPLLHSFDFAAAPATPLVLRPHTCPIIPGVSISGAERGGTAARGSNVITLREAPVIARLARHGRALTVTVRTATGQQTYRITPAMRVLGRGGARWTLPRCGWATSCCGRATRCRTNRLTRSRLSGK